MAKKCYDKNPIGKARPEADRTMCVYRYRDVDDGVIKYVGIVRKGKLSQRIQHHWSEDEWCNGKDWIVEFFCCETQSEVEAFEAHLIALYGTDRYYNVKKAGWGLNKYLPDVEGWWKPAHLVEFEDLETAKAFFLFKRLLKLKMYDEALEILDCLEMEYTDGSRQTENSN